MLHRGYWHTTKTGNNFGLQFHTEKMNTFLGARHTFLGPLHGFRSTLTAGFQKHPKASPAGSDHPLAAHVDPGIMAMSSLALSPWLHVLAPNTHLRLSLFGQHNYVCCSGSALTLPCLAFYNHPLASWSHSSRYNGSFLSSKPNPMEAIVARVAGWLPTRQENQMESVNLAILLILPTDRHLI